MSLESPRGTWFIVYTVITAYILILLPLPQFLNPWRPDWVMLVMIFWSMRLPRRVSVGSAWFVGLLQDVLVDTLLGQHALGLALASYFSGQLYHQLRMFPLWQQSVAVALIILVSQLPLLWIQGMLGYPVPLMVFLFPIFSSLLLWAWVYTLLYELSLRYGVS